MPFVAHDAERGAIAPAQADHRTEYDCFGCDDSMKLRRSHERGETFVAAHFWHPSGRPDGCSAESDTHIQMKSIAASKAQARWPDATVRWEGVVGDRRADVLVEFSEQDDRLGDGVAIECQHKHEEKDIKAVTEDFRDAGLSVLWLYEEHYDGKNVDLDAGDWRVWWPTQVPQADEWTDFHGVIHWLRQEKPNYSKINVELWKIGDFGFEAAHGYVHGQKKWNRTRQMWSCYQSSKKEFRIYRESNKLKVRSGVSPNENGAYIITRADIGLAKYLRRWSSYLETWYGRHNDTNRLRKFQAQGHQPYCEKGNWIVIESYPLGNGKHIQLKSAPNNNPVLVTSFNNGRIGLQLKPKKASQTMKRMSYLIVSYFDVFGEEFQPKRRTAFE